MPATAELDNELKALEINPKACLPQLEQPTDEPDSDAPATDAHVESGVAVAPPESSAKPEIAELSSSEDSSSGAAESAADEKQTMPQRHNKELAELLDELTGELVALKDFPHEIDDRAFEHEWLGKHTDLSLTVFQAELLKTRKHTDDVDRNGKLLSDPVKSRLARGSGARITVRVHHELSEDQKIAFILCLQARDRDRTQEDNQELKRRIIQRWLALGLDYDEIAKLASVCANTVRNVEKRAAADSNSKLGNTKRPDRRYKPATLEKIAKASRLRAEGKDNSEIAKALDTDPDSVRKWLKDPPAEGTTKDKDKPSKKPKASRGDSEAEPKDMTDAVAPVDSVPEVHRRTLEHLGKTQQDYAEWLEDASADARTAVDAAADSVEKVLKLALCSSERLAAANSWLKRNCGADDDVDVEEVSPADSGIDDRKYPVGSRHDAEVIEIKADEVFVTMPDDSKGVIDNRDNCNAPYRPLQVGKDVPVKVIGVDRKRGLWALMQQGRQPATQNRCANAFRPNLTQRGDPNAEVADRQGLSTAKEVI